MFRHEALFWGGFAAIALPILIHLLNRRRFRMRDWAAMKFLLDSLRKNRRRLRIEELILLAVRCLVVALLAMAVGRFTGCSALHVLPGGEGASREVVFLVDDSYSMGQAYGATTLFTTACSDLGRQIEQLPKTDEVGIVLASQAGTGQEFFPLNLITDGPSLQARIQSLRPSHRRADLPQSLQAAGKLFHEDKTQPKWLYVLSDFRRHDLQSSDRGEALRKQFADLRSRGVKIVAMDYGLKASGNLTVASLGLLDRFVVAKAPARCSLTVRNNGPNRAENVEVPLIVRTKTGGEYHDSQPPSLRIDSIDPGESRSVEFAVTCNEPGSAVIIATLPSDELPGDNTGYLALDVRPAVRILLVDGRSEAPDPQDSESFFLSAALDPGSDASTGCKVDVVSPAGLAGVKFEEYDLVGLLNVPDFPLRGASSEGGDAYPQLTQLEAYVRGGGGLMVFTGDRVNLDFYDKRMYADGTGLLPYKLTAPRAATNRDKFYRIDPRSIQPDSMMRTFEGEAVVAATLIRFFSFNPVEEVAPSRSSTQARPPRVLARFADAQNSPAIVHRLYGRGNVLCVYTTASSEWNDWPQQPTEVATFPPVVHDAVSAIARAQEQMQTSMVGQPIHRDLASEEAEAKVLVRTPLYPAADAVALKVNDEEGRRSVRFEQTDWGGVYSLEFTQGDGTTSQVLLARNVDPAEGELTPGGREELVASSGTTDFAYERRTGGADLAEMKAGSDKEYWIWAVVAMLAFLALETFLGQRFGHYSK